MHPPLVIALLTFLAATTTAAEGFPCEFDAPHQNWRAGAGCPALGTSQPCATDADCAALPPACAFGLESSLQCIRSDATGGASVCGYRSRSLPQGFDGRPGWCRRTTAADTCALCTAGRCQGGAFCTEVTKCGPQQNAYSGPFTFECHNSGHSAG